MIVKNIKKVVVSYALIRGLQWLWEQYNKPPSNGLGLIDTTNRKVQNGNEYNYLFPMPTNEDSTILKNTTIHKTVVYMMQLAKKNAWQTKKIADLLKGKTTAQTLRNIFEFTFDHIAYKLDELGTEQVRTPARTWHDRHEGVDCDCFTVFIASILENLNIPYKMRIADYTGNGYQHIYIVAKDQNNTILDPVIMAYDKEKPYLERKDYES